MNSHLTVPQKLALWLLYVPMAVLTMIWERWRYRKVWKAWNDQARRWRAGAPE